MSALTARWAGGLGIALAVALPWAIAQGAMPLGWHDLLAAWREPASVAAVVVWELRIPRVLLAALSGAALAGAGALAQGIFRNPLADPGLLGITAGGAVGAALVIVAGFSGGVPLAACLGAWISTALVYRLGRESDGGGTARMLLVGVALNALLGACLAFLSQVADDQGLRTLTFWLLGSFSHASGAAVAGVALGVVVIGLTARHQAHRLNVLALGESEAAFLGIDTARLQRLIILACAIAIGLTVAAAGSIGFVGLIVPHVMRHLVGSDHRTLVPLSMLAGALLMVVADVAARCWLAPSELPIGIFTAWVGAPWFLMMLGRRRSLPW